MTPAPLLLYIDEDSRAAAWRRALAASGIDTLSCPADRAAITRALRVSADIGVVLVSLPETGMQASELAQWLDDSCTLRPELHVIVTPKAPATERRLLNEGVDSVIDRDWPAELLTAHVHAAITRATRIVRVHAQQRQLAAASLMDTPTGLYNLRALRLRLAEEIDRAGRHARALCLMLLRLDQPLTTTQPTAEVLADALRLINGQLRSYDTIFRVHTSTFAVLLTDCEPLVAASLARRLIAEIDNAAPHHLTAAGNWPRLRLTAAVAGAEEGLTARADLLTIVQHALAEAAVGELTVCNGADSS